MHQRRHRNRYFSTIMKTNVKRLLQPCARFKCSFLIVAAEVAWLKLCNYINWARDCLYSFSTYIVQPSLSLPAQFIEIVPALKLCPYFNLIKMLNFELQPAFFSLFLSRDLIKKLLVVDRTRRLGNMKVCFYYWRLLSISATHYKNQCIVRLQYQEMLFSRPKPVYWEHKYTAACVFT